MVGPELEVANLLDAVEKLDAKLGDGGLGGQDFESRFTASTRRRRRLRIEEDLWFQCGRLAFGFGGDGCADGDADAADAGEIDDGGVVEDEVALGIGFADIRLVEAEVATAELLQVPVRTLRRRDELSDRAASAVASLETWGPSSKD